MSGAAADVLRAAWGGWSAGASVGDSSCDCVLFSAPRRRCELLAHPGQRGKAVRRRHCCTLLLMKSTVSVSTQKACLASGVCERGASVGATSGARRSSLISIAATRDLLLLRCFLLCQPGCVHVEVRNVAVQHDVVLALLPAQPSRLDGLPSVHASSSAGRGVTKKLPHHASCARPRTEQQRREGSSSCGAAGRKRVGDYNTAPTFSSRPFCFSDLKV